MSNKSEKPKEKFSELQKVLQKMQEVPLSTSLFQDSEDLAIVNLMRIVEIYTETEMHPKDYHLLYRYVNEKAEIFTRYLKQQYNREYGINHLLFLYRNVQYHPKAYVRMYCMLIIGTVIIDLFPSYTQIVLQNLIEYCNCVKHPMRSLLLRHSMLKIVKNYLQIHFTTDGEPINQTKITKVFGMENFNDSSSESEDENENDEKYAQIKKDKTEYQLYKFLVTNIVEASKSVLRYESPETTEQNIINDTIEFCFPLQEMYGLLLDNPLITNELLLNEIVPLIIGEIIISTGGQHCKPIIFVSLLECIPPKLILSCLNSFVSAVQQFESDYAFSSLIEVIKSLARMEIERKEFDIIFSALMHFRSVADTDVFLSGLQSLYQTVRSSPNIKEYLYKIYEAIVPIKTPLEENSINNLWNLLCNPIDSEDLKDLIRQQNFRIIVNKIPPARLRAILKKLILNYCDKFTIENEEEMKNLLDITFTYFEFSHEDAARGLRLLHVMKIDDHKRYLHIIKMFEEIVIGGKFTNDSKRLESCLPIFIFTLLQKGREETSIREELVEMIINYLQRLQKINNYQTILIGSQIAITFCQWKRQEYHKIIEMCWETYGIISSSIEQEKCLMIMIGSLSVLKVDKNEALQYRDDIEKKANGLLKTIQKCEMTCRCASLSGYSTQLRDDQHVFEMLKNTAKLGSNVLQSLENVKLFVFILNYFLIHIKTNEYIPIELIKKLVDLISPLISKEDDPKTYIFYLNTLKEIEYRKTIDQRYSLINCSLLNNEK